MERNFAVLTYRPRDTSLPEIGDDVDEGMILERWKFQEILKEMASRIKAQEKPLAEA